MQIGNTHAFVCLNHACVVRLVIMCLSVCHSDRYASRYPYFHSIHRRTHKVNARFCTENKCVRQFRLVTRSVMYYIRLLSLHYEFVCCRSLFSFGFTLFLSFGGGRRECGQCDRRNHSLHDPPSTLKMTSAWVRATRWRI